MPGIKHADLATLAGLAAVEKTRISAKIRALPGCAAIEHPGGLGPFDYFEPASDNRTCYQAILDGDLFYDPDDPEGGVGTICEGCLGLARLIPEQRKASRKLSNAVRRYRRALGEVSS